MGMADAKHGTGLTLQANDGPQNAQLLTQFHLMKGLPPSGSL